MKDELETWRYVPGFEGLYLVSDLGRIKSVNRVTKYPDGHTQLLSERILKPQQNRKKNGGIVFLRKDGKTFSLYVHRLVLLAFVGPCPQGMECCHFPDRDPMNNCLRNLRWDTPTANQGDRKIHGTDGTGERHSQAKLTVQKVLEIRKLHATGKYFQRELAKMFGITRSGIEQIVHRVTWSHV